MLRMGIKTRRLVTAAFGEMQTKGSSLFGCFVRKIARITSGARSLPKPFAANGNLGRVVDISAFGAFGT